MTIVEHVTVNNQMDLQRAITPYEVNGKARDIIIQGFTDLKQRNDAYLQSLQELAESTDMMGGYAPAKPASPIAGRHWVDDIIQKRLGGKREGLLIKWTFQGATFTWEPFTKELKQC